MLTITILSFNCDLLPKFLTVSVHYLPPGKDFKNERPTSRRKLFAFIQNVFPILQVIENMH